MAEAWAGKTVGELDLRGTCGVTETALDPDRSEVLRPGDELIVAGLDEELERLPAAGGIGGLR